MAKIRQIGVIGAPLKTLELPAPNAESSNRFYTLIAYQEGYTIGHTYRVNIDENNNYYWEDIDNRT
jgi:hypothetical protein